MRLLLIYLLLITFPSFSQRSLSEIENLVFLGNFKEGKSEIKKTLSNKHLSLKRRVDYHQLHGDIYKLEGDIDEALVHWQKSNAIRSKIYKKGNYHLAWNYALLSLYHYEKINTPLTKIYADSCSDLLKGLSLSQQKEINIHKIWNILGQALKQQTDGLPHETLLMHYKKVQSYYKKSIHFQEVHITSPHFLAKTYHHLGNSYTDLTLFSSFHKDKQNGLLAYQKANQYYDKAIAIWKKLYGSRHYELGKSLFLKGLLNSYVSASMKPNQLELSLQFYEDALVAYGLSKKANYYDGSNVPNKEDLMMCLKYCTASYLTIYEKNKQLKFLRKAEDINQIAIRVWQGAFNQFKSENVNQNLSIYSLVPFQETISIQVKKKEAAQPWSAERIFEASQKLKYYDLVKSNTLKKNDLPHLSLKAYQKTLDPKSLLLDFVGEVGNSSYFLKVTRGSVKFQKTSQQLYKSVDSLNLAIANFQFANFFRSSRYLFAQFFTKKDIRKFKRIIISPHGFYAKLPFEVLLVSDKNIQSLNYGKLDYLIKHVEIQNILSPRLLGNSLSENFSLNAYAPDNSKLHLSELPFSHRMIEKLEKDKLCMSFSKNKAMLHSFLNSESSILHLSTHGLVNEDHSIFSGLVLSDSMLHLKHIQVMKHVPSIVILNSCNSALGKTYPGDGVDGFVRAFHSIGVENTISNLWEVDDKASNELFYRFHHKLYDRVNTIDALRKSKLEMIAGTTLKGYDAPYYWAGHQLIGGEITFNNEKTPTSRSVIWIVGVIGLVAVGIVLVRKKFIGGKV
jgi:tetratricopeptide (TPR) repeat protein